MSEGSWYRNRRLVDEGDAIRIEYQAFVQHANLGRALRVNAVFVGLKHYPRVSYLPVDTGSCDGTKDQ